MNGQTERKRVTRLPAAALFELENALYEPRFLGVPIGATLTDFFAINFQAGALSLSLAAALRARLGWWRFCWRGPRRKQPLSDLEPGRILVTWLDDTSRLNDLVLPVLAELEPGECNVIGGVASIRQRLPAEIGFCTKVQVTEVDLRSWRREYARGRPEWHRRIRGWLRRHGLPGQLFPHLGYGLAVRSFYVAAFFQFLERTRPRAVLTDSEHNTPWSCLVLAARQRGIPTLQMMHGVIYPPYGYTPLLSDVVLCWGGQHREQMIELGTEPERLVVTGCQRLTRTIVSDPQAVRRRLGLPAAGPVVVLATNPMPREEWRKLVFTFGEAFQDRQDLTAVVRLHASEKSETYRDEIARYPGIRFLENQLWTVEETMAVSDVVVSHNSGLGNDALIYGRLVILLDVLPENPLSNGQTLADRAGSPVARSADELRQCLERIVGDAEYREELHRRAEEYVKWFCAAFGRDAARNVAQEVTRRAKPRILPKPSYAATATLEKAVV